MGVLTQLDLKIKNLKIIKIEFDVKNNMEFIFLGKQIILNGFLPYYIVILKHTLFSVDNMNGRFWESFFIFFIKKTPFKH